ncbi:MAG: glutamate synthase [Chloroflexi bacterium]|nr:glutamate synthase [Chloroflexota bacterium]MDL1885913.1 glutamate synthase [Anaerolineae bacterium CFX8]
MPENDCTNPTPGLHPIDIQERDACALICAVRKGGQPTHGNVKRTIEALTRMGHRTGFVDGEGDGVGIMTDIPRQLWMKKLAKAGLRASLASSRSFWVGHVMIPVAARGNAYALVEQIVQRLADAGLDVLVEEPGEVNRGDLGPNAQKNEPAFWQIAGMNGDVPGHLLETTLFNAQTQLERSLGVHFPSLSAYSVVYKVQGTVEILRRYYPELRDPDYASSVTLGHARYSTNTNPIFERAQPFNAIGHNGEFNTISRMRLEAEMLGIDLAPGNSDSQDVDRVIRALCMNFGLDLIEAMEYIFPPFGHDLIQNAPEIHALYEHIRQAFGPFAQGPAAVVARLGDLCVFSVDALGLRPLWFGESEKEYFATSERGVYTLDSMSVDSKPLAPGEKIAVRITPGHALEVLDYPAIQRHMLARFRERGIQAPDAPAGFWALGDLRSPSAPAYRRNGHTAPAAEPVPVAIAEAEMLPEPLPAVRPAAALPWQERQTPLNTTTMAALGWERFHVAYVEAIAESFKDQVGSLGWDGPLAALSHTRVNLADYFKETVAVVTNPAIDRERERAQFSTRVLVGARPPVDRSPADGDILIQLQTPLLLGGHPSLGESDDMRAAADQHGTLTIEDLLEQFGDRCAIFSLGAALDESIEEALNRLQRAAVEAVRGGIQCIVLDDTDVYSGQRLWLDPLLATAAIDRALRQADDQPNLRRRVGLVVRSGALRDLHDLALCLALGANAVLPYAMYAVGLGLAPRPSRQPLTSEQIVGQLSGLVRIISAGLEKIISTIGCHELRGYGHSFSSIGLTTGVAAYLGTPNYFGSEGRGLSWDALKMDAEERAAEMRGERTGKLANADRLYPKMWKKIEDIAQGEMSLEDYTRDMLELENTMPVAARHIIGLKTVENPPDPNRVDIRIKDHAMPVVIGAMSFGSQGELAYKAYGEAAYHLNIICINGEGGELPDVMGRYPRHRGNQIASGRFGVNIAFLNSCHYLEIKIGQGAKPGEGGQLPGYKVTEQVAAARHTRPGIDLISPSNNHDLYSIEDLAQLIDELKTANPNAKVSVKIPVVPGVGVIAVGVAKAGADIINIAGYEGGTGAARMHSLRHVGLPAEVGVWLSHRALCESGLRDNVELWCDGGMKSGRDVVKMLCLGANRVGFGTLAMVAVGCTICRKCHEGTCHVGITTHIKTKEEAALKGIKHFEPRDYENAVQGICNVFHMLADDIRYWTAQLGFTRTQDLVGRADLLQQIALHDRVDLTPLLQRAPQNQKQRLQPGVGRRLTRPRNTLSKQLTAIIAEHAERGDTELTYDDEQVMAMDRALGTHLAGALKRGAFPNADLVDAVHLTFSNSAIPGNGLAAFIDAPIEVLVEGGAQDGVAKGARGGRVTILKGLNHNGQRLDGSVGKSFAYGAQDGLFIVQGNADTRACIRLSGADVIFGGEVKEPLHDELGGIGARANLKGYACEYMTSGRVLILGDPGPWMCAGMSGGVIYQRVQPEMNLTIEAIRRRIAAGATVDIFQLDEQGVADVTELLRHYIQTLENNNQPEAAQHLYGLLAHPQAHFVKIAPPTRKN